MVGIRADDLEGVVAERGGQRITTGDEGVAVVAREALGHRLLVAGLARVGGIGDRADQVGRPLRRRSDGHGGERADRFDHRVAAVEGDVLPVGLRRRDDADVLADRVRQRGPTGLLGSAVDGHRATGQPRLELRAGPGRAGESRVRHRAGEVGRPRVVHPGLIRIPDTGQGGGTRRHRWARRPRRHRVVDDGDRVLPVVAQGFDQKVVLAGRRGQGVAIGDLGAGKPDRSGDRPGEGHTVHCEFGLFATHENAAWGREAA